MTERRDTDADFDRFVAQLQQEIIEQEEALYSATVIDQAHHPSNIGRLDEPDAYGQVRSWCTDMMEIYLRLDGDRIQEAKFMTDGCGPTVAAGNMLARLVEGMKLEEAGAVLPEQVIEALDGLPEESVHCAELAVNTLQNALFNWRVAQGKA